MKFRVLVLVEDGEPDAWFGQAPNRLVVPEEMFEPGYQPILGRIVRMLAAEAGLTHAEQQWRWGEGYE